jgi:hypothetical protein
MRPSQALQLGTFLIATLVGLALWVPTSRAQSAGARWAPQIPKTWDDTELQSLELPLATPEYSPVHVPAEYYYRVPVQPIYKSYPISLVSKLAGDRLGLN